VTIKRRGVRLRMPNYWPPSGRENRKLCSLTVPINFAHLNRGALVWAYTTDLGRLAVLEHGSIQIQTGYIIFKRVRWPAPTLANLWFLLCSIFRR
jgi:hypothetical protein